MKTKESLKKENNKTDIEKLTKKVNSLRLELKASAGSIIVLSKRVEKLNRKCKSVSKDDSDAKINRSKTLAKRKQGSQEFYKDDRVTITNKIRQPYNIATILGRRAMVA